MIMLSGKNKVDTELYDHVWYVTTTCPRMRVGCEHHPELAIDYAFHLAICKGQITESEFVEEYIKELTSPPKLSHLKELVKRSEAGEWFQLIFYEDSMNEGERKHLFSILKKMTDNVDIE